ncbi:MAG: type II secretion system protein GspC [Geobacteraceae bacterium]
MPSEKRLMNRILTLNIALILLCLVVLAKFAADIVSYRLSQTFTGIVKKADAPPPPAAAEDLMAFAPILEKGLFGKATQGRVTLISQVTDHKTPAATLQNDLLLLGTVVGSFRETFALIQKLSSKEERVFRLGDQVFDIGPLVAVRKEMAEILAGGQRIKILTPTTIAAEASKPPPPQSTGGTPGGLASQVSAGSYVVDQRALNAALDNIGQAMTDARLLPSVKNGKVEGFRASEVKPAGIFGTIGIRNGDTLIRINDFPIDSPEKAIQSFGALKGQSRIKLDLIRDGQPTTFYYDIR